MLSEEETQELREMAASATLREDFRIMRRNSQFGVDELPALVNCNIEIFGAEILKLLRQQTGKDAGSEEGDFCALCRSSRGDHG